MPRFSLGIHEFRRAGLGGVERNSWIPRPSLGMTESRRSGGAKPASLLPGFLANIVAGAGLDPLCALRPFFQLPERGLSLQPVDQEGAGFERGLAVARGGPDQDDAVARFEPAVAVDDDGRRQGPAAMRLGLDLG